MKKALMFSGILAIVLSSCTGTDKKLAEDSARIAELTSEYAEASSFNDSLMLLMGDIYSGLDSINIQEGLLYNMNNGETGDRRAEIRQNLANIKARLASNKELLSSLESKLKNSGNKNGVLQKTITQLKDHISKQDEKISSLESELSAAKGQIQELSGKVAATEAQVKTETAAKEAAQAEAIAAENAANTVYYAIGTNKELKKNGLLEKKFLGQTKVLIGDFNESYFTKADKRSLSVIPTGSKKIKIWTNMPSDSYKVVENADKTKTINITNPKEFWSMTPFLVIQVD